MKHAIACRGLLAMSLSGVGMALWLCSCMQPAPLHVGPQADGSVLTPTEQLLRPAGKVVEFGGRPVDLALSHDGRTLYVKSSGNIVVIDVPSWQIRQTLAYPLEKPKNGASAHGIALSHDGSRLYVTLGRSELIEITVQANGELGEIHGIPLPGPEKDHRSTDPCGLALAADGKTAWVCLSVRDAVASVDLASGQIRFEIPVGVAPYAIRLSPDGKRAYVSNWGGRRPRAGETTAPSGGSPVLVDQHGLPASGGVSIIDLAAKREIGQIETGLHASDLLLSRDGHTLFVANATSDTVSIIDTTSEKVQRTLNVRPDPSLPFGSAPNALALSDDQRTLYVALGGNNAVAVFDLAAAGNQAHGFIPTDWYPGALAMSGDQLLIANVKGIGSRNPVSSGKWNTHNAWGSVACVKMPDAAQLAHYTRQVQHDSRVPQALRAWEAAQAGHAVAPLPKRPGEPSVFQHVIYIIKENRSYDQLLGDAGKGNSDPALCMYGRDVTPNLHALAEQFGLLDNFYDNGVLSADGHAWATQGTAVDYLEKSFGVWVRSYPFSGNDPLAVAPTGFIWDDALLHGLTFTNFGEMVLTRPDPAGYELPPGADYSGKPIAPTIASKNFRNDIGPKDLSPYTRAGYPGWNLQIPDAVRTAVFLKAFAKIRQENDLSNLTIVYLPQDHTRATVPGAYTPRAMVADNDLAVGRIVDAVSHSQFWATTCIFVIEDDPQAGVDHVDGHRSICLVISPYGRCGRVISDFYNQTSVLRTMEMMLGLPPLNQMDAMSPVMSTCFADKPDLAPYACRANRIALDEKNPQASALSGKALDLARQSMKLPFDLPDLADEDVFNRILWSAAEGVDTPYPAAFAGPHGRGLKALHLKLDSSVRKMEDDDD